VPDLYVGCIVHYFPAYDEISILDLPADTPIGARVSRIDNEQNRIVSLHIDTFRSKDAALGSPPRLIYGPASVAVLRVSYDTSGKAGTWRFVSDGRKPEVTSCVSSLS